MQIVRLINQASGAQIIIMGNDALGIQSPNIFKMALLQSRVKVHSYGLNSETAVKQFRQTRDSCHNEVVTFSGSAFRNLMVHCVIQRHIKTHICIIHIFILSAPHQIKIKFSLAQANCRTSNTMNAQVPRTKIILNNVHHRSINNIFHAHMLFPGNVQTHCVYEAFRPM